MLRTSRVVVVGAGIGGLVAALELVARGCEVIVIERAAGVGGKMREVVVGGRPIDAGPTVLTLRRVLDEIFADAGARVDDHLTLHRAEILARHAWSDGSRFDLHADVDRSAEAVRDLAGLAEARRFRQFCARAREVFTTLDEPFMRNASPSVDHLLRGVGVRGLGRLWQIKPFTSLWRELGGYFHDPRLRQLFGRYATYVGSSPFEAPATLMLVAHVEQDGVWLVEGGMHRVARALAELATARGATFRLETEARAILTAKGRAAGVELAEGERIDADAVLFNGDVAALATGLLGEPARAAVDPPGARSLSAITWTLLATTDGFPLHHHNVFFSTDYSAEFEAIFHHGRIPDEPTVYVCAQDRGPGRTVSPDGRERLLCLINAPACGDRHRFEPEEIARCEERSFALLQRCGLRVTWQPEQASVTTPETFHRLFPGTGGALYGRASHGWRTSFERPTARSRLPGLYLAGGSVHPGPGVPMAATSGRLAARTILADLASTRR
jgi:1-hydroxycarotenoid 3,4-desaturase